MTIDEFAMKVKNALWKEGEEREIKISKVLKNNGICLTGLCIPDKDREMTPTVYLDEFLAAVDFVVLMVKHNEIKENMDKLAGKIVLDCHNICNLPGVYHI